MWKNIHIISTLRTAWLKPLFCLFIFLLECQSISAKVADCTQAKGKQQILICQNSTLKALDAEISEKYLNAQLMSNAPLNLLDISQQAWEKFILQCKSKTCLHRQFEQRLDELGFVTTMNQSLTQHFVRYKKQQVDHQFSQIQLQQLDKNRIKIEGMQYRNPNNSDAAQIAYLRSYISPDQKQDILDLESQCKYTINRTATTLEFKATNDKCKRFNGIYKLYD